MRISAYLKYILFILSVFIAFHAMPSAKSDELVKSILRLGEGASGDLNFEPFKKINLSISVKNDENNCDTEVCVYQFDLHKLGQFTFPLPATVKSSHIYENGKLTIVLTQASDVYEGILEIQSCPKSVLKCKCTVDRVLQEISARKNLPEAVHFSADYASSKLKCVKIVSRYQWRK